MRSGHSIKAKYELLLLGFGLLTHCLSLTFAGCYWDDWTIFNVSSEQIMDQYYSNGGIPAGYLQVLFSKIFTSSIHYRILSFGLFYLSSVLIYRKLIQLSFNRNFAFLISLVFLISPIYATRYLIITFPGYVAMTLFFVGMSILVDLFDDKAGILRRLLLVVVFSLSFINPSGIPFYYGILALVIFRKAGDFKLKNIWRQVFRFPELWVFPVVFFVLYGKFFAPDPEGMHAMGKYNLIDIYKLKYNWIFIRAEVIKFFWWQIKDIVSTPFVFIIMATISFASLIVWKPDIENAALTWKKGVWFILIALFLIFCAGFSFNMVGKVPKMPHESDFESRYQIYLGLGYGLLVVAVMGMLFQLISKRWINYVLVALCAGLMINSSWHIQTELGVESIKQDQLANTLKQTNLNQQQYFIKDCNNWNSFSRDLNFYEYIGLIEYYNLNSRLFITAENFKSMVKRYGSMDVINNKGEFNLKGYNFTIPQDTIVVSCPAVKSKLNYLLRYQMGVVSDPAFDVTIE